ncbi:MAG: sugar phosphate nucleotidyltransferase [Nitratireductor sp.]
MAGPKFELNEMSVVILAGGMGTRMQEHTSALPKPMVRLAERPILWHIMKHYSMFGVRRFVICLGYLGDQIRDYFVNYWRYNRDIQIGLKDHDIQVLPGQDDPEDWEIILCETGARTLTAKRVKQVLQRIGQDTFFLTYGDGLASVDVAKTLSHHRAQNGTLATITAVRPSSRFGELDISGNKITNFHEKPQSSGGWINGGFMVMEKQAFDHLSIDDDVSLEEGVLSYLAEQHALSVYRHNGFWQCMDTPRERDLLEGLWLSGDAPWLRITS